MRAKANAARSEATKKRERKEDGALVASDRTECAATGAGDSATQADGAHQHGRRNAPKSAPHGLALGIKRPRICRKCLQIAYRQQTKKKPASVCIAGFPCL